MGELSRPECEIRETLKILHSEVAGANVASDSSEAKLKIPVSGANSVPLGLSSGKEWCRHDVDSQVMVSVSVVIKSCGLGEILKSLILELGFSAVKKLFEELDPRVMPSPSLQDKLVSDSPASGLEAKVLSPPVGLKVGGIEFKFSKGLVPIDLPCVKKDFVDIRLRRTLCCKFV
ncbi:hypothetical protein KI387_023451, partial [Taxus chinensis]